MLLLLLRLLLVLLLLLRLRLRRLVALRATSLEPGAATKLSSVGHGGPRDTDHWWRGGSAVGNPICYVTAGRGDLEDHEGHSEDRRAARRRW